MAASTTLHKASSPHPEGSARLLLGAVARAKSGLSRSTERSRTVGHFEAIQFNLQWHADIEKPSPAQVEEATRLSAKAAELQGTLAITPGDMLPRDIAEIQAEIEKVDGELKSLGVDPPHSPKVHKRSGDDPAMALAKRLAQLQENFAALIGQNGGPTKVTMDHLLDAAEVEYGIRLKDMTPDEEKRLSGLYDRMESVIFGQTLALKPIISRFIQAEKAQGRSTPMGAFLLVGPPGVGKTATGEALARFAYDDPSCLFVFDCSRFKGDD